MQLLVDLMFSLTNESISFIVSSALESLSSISCVLLLMFTFVVPDHFLISSVFIIPSVLTEQSQMAERHLRDCLRSLATREMKI